MLSLGHVITKIWTFRFDEYRRLALTSGALLSIPSTRKSRKLFPTFIGLIFLPKPTFFPVSAFDTFGVIFGVFFVQCLGVTRAIDPPVPFLRYESAMEWLAKVRQASRRVKYFCQRGTEPLVKKVLYPRTLATFHDHFLSGGGCLRSSMGGCRRMTTNVLHEPDNVERP